jgi:hypothetical protein
MGLHQSDHNRCLIKGVVTKMVGEELEEGMELMFLRGQGIGMFLSQAKPEEVFYAPGFGWCSIDRPWVDDEGNPVPMELKSTRFSSKYPITEWTKGEGYKHANYICQLATYVVKKLRNERAEINSVRRSVEWDELDGEVVISSKRYSGFLYVLYELGDYTNRKPEQRCFELQYTGAELLSWEGELDRRHGLLTTSLRHLNLPYYTDLLATVGDHLPIAFEDIAPALPPVEEHFAWECEAYSRCPLKDLIGCPGDKNNAKWTLPFHIEEEYYTRAEKEKIPRPPKGGKK